MGALDPRHLEHGGHDAMADTRPIHRVYVDPVLDGRTEVTNEQFAAFVKATGYVTVAEKKPTREEFPTAPEENLVAGSVVFTPVAQAVPLDDHYRWWSYVRGASWRHPLGRRATSRAARSSPSCTWPTKTPRPTRAGRASAFPRRRSGSSRRAAA
jgi:formylglycine-generating enzyme required for sulfatase activity